jgi:hypothetical protein
MNMQCVDSTRLAGTNNAIPLVGFIQPGNHGLKSMTLRTDPPNIGRLDKLLVERN